MGIFKLVFAVYVIRTFATFIRKNLDKETLSFPRKTNLHLNMDALRKKSTNSSKLPLPSDVQDVNPVEDSALLRDPALISAPLIASTLHQNHHKHHRSQSSEVHVASKI